MTDFRALCEELVELLEVSEEWSGCTQPRALTRARAALAEQPVRPTDEEIMELMPQQMRDDLSTAARALGRFHQGSDHKTLAVHRIILNRHAVDHARAILARWGQS